ncbi:MAG: hypothetical protein AAGJ29_05985 [Pseudomonadota bacterium]
MIRPALIAASLLTAAPPPSMAEETNVTGNWTFTAWIDSTCEFTGVARLGPPADDGAPRSCELTARQVCNDDLSWTVRQTCTANRSGDRLIIRSEIAEFLEGGPSPSYLPDNFVLSIESSKRMFGALHSYGVHKAVWQREEGAIS